MTAHHLTLVPDTSPNGTTSQHISHQNGRPKARKQRSAYDLVKRGIDIAGSGVALLVLSPVIGGVSLAVRAKLGSPVFFKQERPGRNGEVFTLYKFRSMLLEDESKGRISNEDRITGFGQKLRATSLDELPSLWNVLKGDMSLVGPRPLHVRYLERYSPHQSRRHEVRPGLTGLAQVNGRNELDWAARLDLDVQYVDTRSFGHDVRIVARTLLTVFKRSGITAEGRVASSEFHGDTDTTVEETHAQSDTAMSSVRVLS